MIQEWYYSRNGQKHGPTSGADLKQLAVAGKLLPTDHVWKEGMAKWAAARSVKGLFPAAQAPEATAAPPPPPAKAASPVADRAGEVVEIMPASAKPSLQVWLMGLFGKVKRLCQPLGTPAKVGIVGAAVSGVFLLLLLFCVLPLWWFIGKGNKSDSAMGSNENAKTVANRPQEKNGPGIKGPRRRGWKLQRSVESEENRYSTPMFFPNEQSILVGGSAVKLLDAESLEDRAVLDPSKTLTSGTGMAFSLQGDFVAWTSAKYKGGSSNEFGLVKVYDVARKDVVATLLPHMNELNQGKRSSYPLFSPDGKWLITTSQPDSQFTRSGKHVHVYNTGTWAREKILAGAYPAFFTSDGSRLAVQDQVVKRGKKHKAIIIYNLPDFTEVKRLQFGLQNGYAGGWALSPDGRTIVMSFVKGNVIEVTLWDVDSNQQRETLYKLTIPHGAAKRGIANYSFSSDGKKVSAIERLEGHGKGGLEKTIDSVIWVWDMEKKETVAIRGGESMALGRVSFSKDGTRIVAEGTIDHLAESGHSRNVLSVFVEAEEPGIRFPYRAEGASDPFEGESGVGDTADELLARLRIGMSKQAVAGFLGQPAIWNPIGLGEACLYHASQEDDIFITFDKQGRLFTMHIQDRASPEKTRGFQSSP